MNRLVDIRFRGANVAATPKETVNPRRVLQVQIDKIWNMHFRFIKGQHSTPKATLQAEVIERFVTESQTKTLFIVVQPNRARAMKMMADLRKAFPHGTLRHAMDLTEAYNLSEHTQPDLVLLDHDVCQDSGLTMFLSLLSALAIDWTVVIQDKAKEHITQSRQVKLDTLAAFLEHDWRPRAGRPHRPPANNLVDVGTSNVPSARRPAKPKSKGTENWKTIVIGASTGGIEALIEVLSQFPPNAPPTVIVQHIKGAFLPGLADRLDRLCAPRVRAADGRTELHSGQVLLAPGETQHLVITRGGRACQLEAGPPRNGHRPSVDALFASAARYLGSQTVGVILSGMGRDGANGLLDIRNKGGWTIGQDKATSVVYGMPRVAAEIGAVRQQLPLPEICNAVLRSAALKRKRLHDA